MKKRSGDNEKYFGKGYIQKYVNEIMKIDKKYRLGDTPFMQLGMGKNIQDHQFINHKSSAYFECVLIMGRNI